MCRQWRYPSRRDEIHPNGRATIGDVTAPDRTGCPHCDPEHRDPASRPWNVRVGPERDSDGQPVYLYALPADGAHVAESDAAWLWQLIRDAQSSGPALREKVTEP